MADEIVSISWMQRLKNSLVGLVLGIICIILGIYVLFWNEKNTLYVHQSLLEIEKKLSKVSDSHIDSVYNQKAIYVTGIANTEDNLQDPSLNIDINAIQLNRQVEMYQWQEKKIIERDKRISGRVQQITHYEYQPAWSNQLIDSTKFKTPEQHLNPSKMPIRPQTSYAQNVFLGKFHLSLELIKRMGPPEFLQLNEQNLESITKALNIKGSIYENNIYLGNNPKAPSIGDVKISLSAIYPQKISIIGMQDQNNIVPYISSYGEKILILHNGEVSPLQMIAEEMSNRELFSWILRGISLSLLTLGFYLFLSPLVTLVEIVPILGDIFAMGIGFISFIISLCFWGLLTAIAWIMIRPLYTLSFVCLISLLATYLVRRKSKKIRALQSKPN